MDLPTMVIQNALCDCSVLIMIHHAANVCVSSRPYQCPSCVYFKIMIIFYEALEPCQVLYWSPWNPSDSLPSDNCCLCSVTQPVCYSFHVCLMDVGLPCLFFYQSSVGSQPIGVHVCNSIQLRERSPLTRGLPHSPHWFDSTSIFLALSSQLIDLCIIFSVLLSGADSYLVDCTWTV